MSVVKGVDKVRRRLEYIKRKGIVEATRWLIKWANKYAVHERQQFHKGKPGYWTGQMKRSIGVSAVNIEGGKQSVLVGPGCQQASRSGFSAWGESWKIKAIVLEKGNMRPHFLGFRDHPMFEFWARSHGIRTTNKLGVVTGGLMVGTKDSILKRGIHYKAAADKAIVPQIMQAKKELLEKLKALTIEAKAAIH